MTACDVEEMWLQLLTDGGDVATSLSAPQAPVVYLFLPPPPKCRCHHCLRSRAPTTSSSPHPPLDPQEATTLIARVPALPTSPSGSGWLDPRPMVKGLGSGLERDYRHLYPCVAALFIGSPPQASASVANVVFTDSTVVLPPPCHPDRSPHGQDG
jgi:hypothetical protein